MAGKKKEEKLLEMSQNVTFCEWLEHIRADELNVSVYEFCKRIGKSRQNYSKMISANSCTEKNMREIAESLECTLEIRLIKKFK